MYSRGPSDPVKISRTSEIAGDLIEPEDVRDVVVEDEDDEPVGLLIKWDSACWMWADAEDFEDLN